MSCTRARRPGSQFAALSGDPAVGPYTRMRRVPAGTDNPRHSHTSEITNVIISGVLYTGTDKASAKDFGPATGNLITGAGTSIGALGGALTIARWRVIAIVLGTLWAGSILIGFAYNFFVL